MCVLFLGAFFGRIFGVTHIDTNTHKRRRNLKLATAKTTPLPCSPRPTPSTSFWAAGDAFLIAATEPTEKTPPYHQPKNKDLKTRCVLAQWWPGCWKSSLPN